MADEDVENTPDLSISPDKVCNIIARAREFDAKDVVTDPNDSSNPTDDAMVAVLGDHRDDPVVQEIAAAVFAIARTNRSIWLRLPGSAAATVRSRTGTSCTPRPRALTTSAPLHICSACRCWPTTSTKPWRSSASPATSDSAGASRRVCSRNLILCFFGEAPIALTGNRSLLGTTESNKVP